MRIIVLISFAFMSFFIDSSVTGQENDKNWYLNGYVSNIQSVMQIDMKNIYMSSAPNSIFMLPGSIRDSIIDAGASMLDSLTGGILIDNIIHNRLNFYWDISSKLRFSAQVRNQIFYGDQVRLFGNSFKNSKGNDEGIIDLSGNILSGSAFLINTQLDRLWLNYSSGNLEVTVGRQRINWGQTFVWNPNDIFNNYSFFDIDYPERPGSDALRIEYFTGMTSSVEAAVKVDSANSITAAGLLNMNRWNFDFQFMAGYLNSEDISIGGGWSGFLKNIGFRGEMSYFHPSSNFSDTTGVFLASLESDYTFENSLMIQSEVLFAQVPDQLKSGNFSELYSSPLSVKTMAIDKWNIFAQVTYPVTPLLNTTLSGMYFPENKGYYIGPSFTYSITDNIDVSFYAQLFSLENYDVLVNRVSRQNINLLYLKIKGSF